MLRQCGLLITALFVDDASNSQVTPPNSTPTITTHIDGAFHVVVVADSQDLGDYQAKLTALRAATEAEFKAHSDSQPVDLTGTVHAHFNASIALRQLTSAADTLASCVGEVRFPELAASARPLAGTATISKDASGTWVAACPAV